MDSVFSRAPAQLAAAAVLVASLLVGAPAGAAGAPPEPSAAQPSLPPSGNPPNGNPPGGKPPVSPLIQRTIGAGAKPAEARKHASRHAQLRHHVAHRYRAVPLDLERPAVAGVTLLVPLPRPEEPPHLTVPLPAYPLDSLATYVTTPPTPVVCHHVPREPGLPDPELYRERTLQCQPDNP